MKYLYNGAELYPSVEVYPDAVPYFAGITGREFYLSPEKSAAAWKIAVNAVNELFDGEISLRPTTAPISYIHLIALGCEPVFTDTGEPNIHPAADSVAEGIEILRRARGMDFISSPIVKERIVMSQALAREFPDRNTRFGGGQEGPLTSAALFIGENFFADLMEEPELTAEYISLMTDSCIAYTQAMSVYAGNPPVAVNGGLCDDMASFIPPRMWGKFVVPYINRFLDETVREGGKRFLHCENVTPEQLPYLKDMRITHYQPSVSPKLTIGNIKANTDIPFDWLLYAYHITEMSDEEIERWVDDTVHAGVTKIRTQIGQYGLKKGKAGKIKAFLRAFDKYSVN